MKKLDFFYRSDELIAISNKINELVDGFNRMEVYLEKLTKQLEVKEKLKTKKRIKYENN